MDKKKENRSKSIQIRLTEEEHNIIKDKAKLANTSVSDFSRKSVMGQTISTIHDGKVLAKKIGMVHRKMIGYHNDMMEHIQELKDAISDNEKASSCIQNRNDVEASEVFQLQKLRIDAVLKLMVQNYDGMIRKSEEELNQVVSAVLEEE